RRITLAALAAPAVAARGIDVKGAPHAITYPCPEDEKPYIHRIGRTGRAGASGIAVTFVDWADLHRWKLINKALELPFDEPQETYSTSPHIYHDLAIPSDAKGRIAPPRPAQEEVAEKPRKERAPRTSTRQRTRTRGGQQVAGAPADKAASANGEQPAGSERPAGQARRRRRRRRSSGSSSAQA